LRCGLIRARPLRASGEMPFCDPKSRRSGQKVWDDNWKVYGVRKT